MATFTEKVVVEFRNHVTDTYELDSEVVDTLCKFVAQSCETVGVPTGGRTRTRRATTTKRKKSGYNVYVRTLMSEDDEIKNLSHREKMTAIGGRWKSLSDAQREEFNTRAREENEKESAAAESADENTTSA